MDHQNRDIVYDDWSLLHEAQDSERPDRVAISEPDLRGIEREFKYPIERQDKHNIKPVVQRLLADMLCPRGERLGFEIGFSLVPINTSSQGHSEEVTPTIHINVIGDFEGALGLTNRRKKLSNQGITDPKIENYWRIKKIEIEFQLGNLFRALRNYQAIPMFSLVTFMVRFHDPQDTTRNEPYHSYPSAIMKIYELSP